MKKITILLSIFFIYTTVFAQKGKSGNISYYVFDAAWKPCNTDDAVYFAILEKLNDTAWQWKNYLFSGPLLSVETYKDEDGTIPHGYFAWFDSNGNIDSSGETFGGRKHGSWYYFTDSLSVWQTEKYENGILSERKDSILLRNEKRSNDSIGYLPGDKEAVFKGGTNAWIKYLQNNIKIPGRAEKMGKSGTVKIFFMVDSDGSLKDLRLYKSVEYSLDEEALRLISKSPKWEPARQMDKPVKAYRIQPITIVF